MTIPGRPPPTPTSAVPKAILFDIGGVVVNSPMAAIAAYERSHSMPPGWINFSISRSGPNGAWGKIERGEVLLDAAFFEEFNRDLSREELWKDFWAKNAEKKQADGKGVSVQNTVTITELSSTTVLSAAGADAKVPQLPPVPAIDGEWLYWEMMRISRNPDPHMLAALKKLRASGRFLIAALSNTTIFPPEHEYSRLAQDPSLDYKSWFSVFVSSAHVGMRKPEPGIYELTLRMMQEEWAVQEREGTLAAGDVLFLDDIGTNLAQGRRMGFRTLKVTLGDTKGAVRELERITGMPLLDGAEPKL